MRRAFAVIAGWLVAFAPAIAAAADAPVPSIDVQVIAATTSAQNDVTLVLMVTGDGLDPSALPADSDQCDGSGYTRGEDPPEVACYKIVATENGQPVSALSYQQLFNHGTVGYLQLRYHTPVEPRHARTLRIDLSFTLGNDVVRNRNPEAGIDMAGFSSDAFPDPDNPWAPLYAFQDRRLNALYAGLTGSPQVAGDPELRSLATKAEQDWVASKEADCSAPLMPTPLEVDWCRTLRATDRIDHLTALRRSAAGATP